MCPALYDFQQKLWDISFQIYLFLNRLLGRFDVAGFYICPWLFFKKAAMQ